MNRRHRLRFGRLAPTGTLALLLALSPAASVHAVRDPSPDHPQTHREEPRKNTTSGMHPQWGMNPAPGSDCPKGSTKLATLLTEDFSAGGTNLAKKAATIVTEGGQTFARHTGIAGKAAGSILTARTVTPRTGRFYAKFDVRGTFGSHDLIGTTVRSGGGWYVAPAAAATPPADPGTWRKVWLDLTDGANESYWDNNLQVELLREGTTATTVDIDNIELYQCTPAPVGEPGDFNGDGLADAKFIMANGDLVMVAGTLAAPVSYWRAGVGWGSFTWLGSVGDTDKNGYSDLVGRTQDGRMLSYSGDGVRSFTTAKEVGIGWEEMTSILPVGDVDGDGRQEVIARSPDGTMRMYFFRPDGLMDGGKVVGSGWQYFRHIVAIRTPGAATRLYAIAQNGDMKSYTVTSSGAMSGWGTKVGNGWMFPKVAGVGDFDGDGLDDVLGVAADGHAYLYPTNGEGKWKAMLTLPETWWNAAVVIG